MAKDVFEDRIEKPIIVLEDVPSDKQAEYQAFFESVEKVVNGEV